MLHMEQVIDTYSDCTIAAISKTVVLNKNEQEMTKKYNSNNSMLTF